METILYSYNHKTTTGQTPAHIFLYARQPTLNTQDRKENLIKSTETKKNAKSIPNIEKDRYKKEN